MIPVFQILLALLLDALLGEPRRWHPLVGFGRLAQGVEARLYGGACLSARQRRWRGRLAWALLVLPPTGLLALLLHALPVTGSDQLLGTAVLYLALGRRALHEHAARVAAALQAGDLPRARQGVGHMVSRDTAPLDGSGISRATIESVLENGNDAIFGTLFWFLLLGAPGALLYRLANTLDAMWGYRNARYRHFGQAAARLDDALNWAPARLTALSYALAGHLASALRCWRRQAPRWAGRNAGAVMASGSGALQVRLGGPAWYHGQPVHRPVLGTGRLPAATDIVRSSRFVDRALGLWLVVLLTGGAILG